MNLTEPSDSTFNKDSDPDHLSNYNDIYTQPRSLALAHLQVGEWRNQEKTRTSFGIIALCLNIGTDPPDLYRPEDTPIIEAGIDPFKAVDEFAPRSFKEKAYANEDSKGKAPKVKSPLERIGNSVQLSYSEISKTTHFRAALDPAYEEFKRLISHVRQEIKDDRMLLHYNGHGVPKPSAGGDIWVFNKSFSQYIPLSAIELSTWVGCPALYVWDISNSESVIMAFEAAAEIKAKETEILYNKRRQLQLNSKDPENKKFYTKSSTPNFLSLYKNEIHLGATKRFEDLPLNPEVPTDLFTECLTNPIEAALKFHAMRKGGLMKKLFNAGFKIPGTTRERRTPLGELTWIFTSITDTIAWDILPRDLFRQLFRQDVMVASLCRNFILSDRILRYYGCHPVSFPKFPSTHLHIQWETWDLEVDSCIQQFMKSVQGYDLDSQSSIDSKKLISKMNLEKIQYDHSKYFLNQLDAFDIWLHHAKSIVVCHLSAVNSLSTKDSEIEVDGRRAGGIRSLTLGAPSGLEPPLELPVVLQVLLSQNYRHNALALLYSFLVLGPWAVDLAYAIGISPFIVKLLGSATNEITGLLILVWAKLVAGDPDCSKELLKNDGYRYFINYLGQSSSEADRFYHDILQSDSKVASDKIKSLDSIETDSSVKDQQNHINDETQTKLLKDIKTLNVVSTAACFVICMFCNLGKSAQAAVFKDDCLNYIYTHLIRPDDETPELAQLKIWAILTLSAITDNYLEAQWMSITYRECVINAKKDSLVSSYLKNSRPNISKQEYQNINDIEDPYLKQKLIEIENDTSVRDISELLIPLAFHKEQRVRNASVHAIGSLLKGLRVLSEGKNLKRDEFIDILVEMKVGNVWEQRYKFNENSSEDLENSFNNLNLGKPSKFKSQNNNISDREEKKTQANQPYNDRVSENGEGIDSYNLKVAKKARRTEIMLWEALLSISQDGSPMVRREVVNVIGLSIIHSYTVEFIRAIAIVSCEETGSDSFYLDKPSKPLQGSSKTDPSLENSTSVVVDYMVKFYKTLLVLSSDPHLDVMQSSMRIIDLMFQAYTRSCYFILTPQINLSNHIHNWSTNTTLSGISPPTLSLKTLKTKRSHVSNKKQNNISNSNSSLASSSSLNKSSDTDNRHPSQSINSKNLLDPNSLKGSDDLRNKDPSMNTHDLGEKILFNNSSDEVMFDQSHEGLANKEIEALKLKVTKLQDTWIEYSKIQLVTFLGISQIFDWEGAYILESDLVQSINTETNSELLIKAEKKKIQLEFTEISTEYREKHYMTKFVNKVELLPPNIIPGPTSTIFHPTNPHLLIASQKGDICVIDYSTKNIISRFDVLNPSSEIFSPVKDLHLVNPESRTLLLSVYDDGVIRIFNSYAPTPSINDIEQHQRQLLDSNFDIKSLKFPVPELLTTFRGITNVSPIKKSQNPFVVINPLQKTNNRINRIQKGYSVGQQNSVQSIFNENSSDQHIGCGVVSDFNQHTGNLFVGSKNSQVVNVWDLDSEQMTNKISPKFLFSNISSISVENQGNLVVVGCTDGVVKLHDLRISSNNSLVQSWRDMYPHQIQSSFFMELNDNNIYSASVVGSVYVWDIRNKKLALNFKSKNENTFDLSLRGMVGQRHSTFLATNNNYSVELYNSSGNNLGSFQSLSESNYQASESLFTSFRSNFNIFGSANTNEFDSSSPVNYYEKDSLYPNVNFTQRSSPQPEALNNKPIINSLNYTKNSNPYSKILGNSSYLSSVDNLRALGVKFDLSDLSSNSEQNTMGGFVSLVENFGYSDKNHINGYRGNRFVENHTSLPINLSSNEIKTSNSDSTGSQDIILDESFFKIYPKPEKSSSHLNLYRSRSGLTPPTPGNNQTETYGGTPTALNLRSNSAAPTSTTTTWNSDISKDVYEFAASMDDRSINSVSFHPYLPQLSMALEDGSIYMIKN
ncbi:WD repeat-containing protein mip1 [Smittium mucronatum]|uniref:WD repeat-containing protein mip1 n=1 Tax=Smittium mucronatum TaxID=133383 RepID=A0A1R0H453_9FUNG|nr:WD repeat-containing protein mip1 [Smittium mucronatum]